MLIALLSKSNEIFGSHITTNVILDKLCVINVACRFYSIELKTLFMMINEHN